MASMGQPRRMETDILKPLSPSDTDADDWPQILLSNARVFRCTERDELIDLLLATEHDPVTVVGTINPHGIENKLLQAGPTHKRSAKVTIEVRDVRTFAYGQFDNGAIALWAAGRAGWYTIQPAKSYAPVYDRMTQAVRMLYFVTDAYRDERRIGRGRNSRALPPFSAQELFGKYALEVLGLPNATSEAASVVYKHKDFLLTSMISGKEGIMWKTNPLYLHLRKKFAKEHASIVRRLAGPQLAASIRSVRQGSQDSVASADSVKRRVGRLRKVQIPDSQSTEDTTRVTGANTAVERSVSTDSDAGSFRSRTTRRSPRHGKDAPEADESSIHETAAINRPATPLAEVSESEDEAPLARKGKSILRPKPSQGAKSTQWGRVGEADDDEVLEPPPSPSAIKRKAEETFENGSSKRRQNKADFDEGIDMPESPSAMEDTGTASHTDADGETAGYNLPGAQDHGTTVADPAGLLHRDDPVQEDTWVCALDGCTHKVYAASKPDSQRLIREHYALHAYDDDERIKLVKRLQHPSLPVNHLMEKVRLQAKLEGFPNSQLGGSRFPPAVVSRY